MKIKFDVYFVLLVLFLLPVAAGGLTVEQSEKMVWHKGELVADRLVPFIDSDHDSFFTGLFTPIELAFALLLSNISSQPMGYGLTVGELLDVTWAEGSDAYRSGFFLGAGGILPVLAIGFVAVALVVGIFDLVKRLLARMRRQ